MKTKINKMVAALAAALCVGMLFLSGCNHCDDCDSCGGHCYQTSDEVVEHALFDN